MHTVMIVEDEMLVRLGIKCLINWEKLDMTVIAEVGDGQSAWEVYQREKPDLILTDIKMPVMDGIQLVEKIREQDDKTKVIILSCLEEFQYARKALQLGVSAYIMKLTMSQAEVQAILEKVKGELLRDNKSLEAPIIDRLNISRNKIISDYVLYGLYNDKNFEELAKSLEIKIKPEKLAVCVMDLDQYKQLTEKFKDEQGNTVFFSVLNTMNELLTFHKRGVACHEKDQRFVLIFSFFDIESESEVDVALSEITEHIRRGMKTYFDTTVTCGISGMMSGYPALKALYRQAIQAVTCKYFIGSGGDIDYAALPPRDIMIGSAMQKLSDATSEYFSPKDVGIERLLEPSCSFEKNVELFTQVFLRLGQQALVTSHIRISEISGAIVNYSERIRNCETIDESIQIYTEYLQEIAGKKRGRKCYSKEVVSVIKYVQEHYQEDLSVQQIADTVGLSPNYLSSHFKSEFGSGLVEYITQVRIEKAKDLILSTTMKSYEIAETVGFSNESYFSRTFKKVTGITPNEFKKHWM